MNRRLFPLLLVSALSSAAPACAQIPAVGPQAQPVAQVSVEGLGYFVGTWLVSAKDPGTGQTVELLYRVEPALGGSWITGYGESAALGLKSRDMWGRDPAGGGIIRVIFDGSGTLGTVRSPGWRGDTLVLEGDAQSKGGVVRVRETIRRVSPHEFEAVWEALRDGEWKPYSVERVTRWAVS